MSGFVGEKRPGAALDKTLIGRLTMCGAGTGAHTLRSYENNDRRFTCANSRQSTKSTTRLIAYGGKE
jgi:hypothetical protein